MGALAVRHHRVASLLQPCIERREDGSQFRTAGLGNEGDNLLQAVALWGVGHELTIVQNETVKVRS
jgi:hypothetical protein